jgi:DNA-binding NarL/FixJ family response regulator
LELIERGMPHIILLDLEMPILNGFETLPILVKFYPQIKVIILSAHNEEVLVSYLMSKGACSFLPKSCTMNDIIKAINSVYREGYFFDECISKLIVSDYLKNNQLTSENASDLLSEREIQVLKLYCNGFSYKSISTKLSISLNTVKYHLKNIYKKTEISSLPALVKYTIKKGITDL